MSTDQGVVMRAGRKQPYTAEGIKRLKCVRCGAQAWATWQACADDGLHRPICRACDIALNDLALKFMCDPHRAHKMAAYRAKVEAS